MRNLDPKIGPAKIEDALQDLNLELEVEADETPRAGEMAAEVEVHRQGVETAAKAHRKAGAGGRVWGRRVGRADRAVKKATTAVSDALHPNRDEPAVAEVISLAFPVSASEGTAGFADEKQANFVLNVIERVQAARDMPPKVVQRVAELVAAKAKLDGALAKRQAARYAEEQAKVELDRVVAAACAFYNDLFFDVGKLFGKAKADAIFAR